MEFLKNLVVDLWGNSIMGQSQISASLKILERAGNPILYSSPEALGKIIVYFAVNRN